MHYSLNINAVLIIGLGQSGMACAQFLKRQGCSVFVFADTRLAPQMLADFKQAFGNATFALGEFSDELLDGVDTVVLSPGFDPRHNIVKAAQDRRIDVVGEVELFARVVDKPVIGITGTNGKSTATVLTGELLKAAGFNVIVGGNLGTPTVELLNDKADVYVVELSSFQLETTRSLKLTSATILNVSDDHADRYDSYADYVAAKFNIYKHAELAVINQDDGYLNSSLPNCNYMTFSVYQSADYMYVDGCLKADSFNVESNALKMSGLHNYANALVALALVSPITDVNDAMLKALKKFSGLPHRMQHVSCIDGVDYFNDSKATNVGATLAALNGLQKKVILIAGGVTKEQDFEPLRDGLKHYVSELVLIGEETSELSNQLNDCVPQYIAKCMQDAVEYAHQKSLETRNFEAVLLSPACASFDQYNGFEARGQHFIDCVNALPKEPISKVGVGA